MINMVKGIIFDMDGVISDTQKLHSKVECELLRRYDVNITPEDITKKYSGVRTKEFFITLLNQQNKQYNIDDLMNEKWARMEKLAAESVDAIPGSIDLIKMFYEMKLPLAVDSASNFNYVRSVLSTLGVTNYFTAIVSGDMVSKGKPDPESFLLAATKINIQPEKCLVIEAGTSGMAAAKAGKMRCIGLVGNKGKEYPTQNLILSLSEITPGYLNQIQ